MTLPFTPSQFLDVFQTYNESVWPMQIVLYLLALTSIFLAITNRAASSRGVSVILAFLWLWMGIVYHLMNFTTINRAAYAFGLLFVVQGFLFFYAGVFKSELSFRLHSDWYTVVGALLLLYALVIYPALGQGLGHSYPRSPTFGLPCPSTIFTFGILLWADKKVPLFIVFIPFIWSLIGSSAALSLGMREDAGLLVAGCVGSAAIYFHSRQVGRGQLRHERPEAH